MIFEPESIQLQIRDNGQGFDPQSLNKPMLPVYQQWGGFGLIGMRERIEALGGHLTIESERQQGVHMYVLIPHQNAAFALMRGAYESIH
jgi:two-component system sensor histidine kinase DegS